MPSGASSGGTCIISLFALSMSHHHSLGEQPAHTEFPELNAPPVVPRAFPNWAKVMDECVYFMIDHPDIR